MIESIDYALKVKDDIPVMRYNIFRMSEADSLPQVFVSHTKH